MRTRCSCCLLALGLLAPACLAQSAADDRVEQEKNEDVEVLRQLLTEAVQSLYHRPQERIAKNCVTCHVVPESAVRALAFAPDGKRLFSGSHDGTVRVWDATDGKQLAVLDGHHGIIARTRVASLANYVPGHGIIVQLEAPRPVVNQDVKAWVTADSSTPSRWEILRRELRGEPEKNPPLWPQLLGHEYRRVHRLELTEKVVEVLIENGRNLRHLVADDRVTVAFTFRAPEKNSKEAARTTLLRHYGVPASEAAAEAPKAVDKSKRGAKDTLSVTGDLHLRQGQFAEAIAAYEHALKVAGVNIDERTEPVPPNAAEAVKSLIQAHVGAGTEDSWARATKLRDWLKRSQTSQDDELTFLRRAYLDVTGALPTPEDVKTYHADARPNRRELLLDHLLNLDHLLAQVEDGDSESRLPSRMVVACTKKQLDDVASGKLSKLDLAGQITLKYYKPASRESKQKTPHHKK